MGYNDQDAGRQMVEDHYKLGSKEWVFDIENPASLRYLSKDGLVRVADADGKKIDINLTKKKQSVRINAPKFYGLLSSDPHDFCVPVNIGIGNMRMWDTLNRRWCNH